MRKLFNIILILTIIFMTEVCTYSQTLYKDDIVEYIENAVYQELEEKGYYDTQVTVLGVPFIKLNIPDGKISYQMSKNSSAIMSREFRVITIKVEDKFVRTLGVPLKIVAHKNVIVAKEQIERGSVLAKNIVAIRKVDVTNQYMQPLEPNDLNKPLVVTKLYKAGDVIDKKFVKAQPDVIKNTPVTLYFQSKNDLSITLDGIAMTEGNKGDTITIKNQKYNRVYTGKVIGENKVMVKI